MRRRIIGGMLFVCLLGLVLSMAGCGGSSSSDSPTTPTIYSVTGRWDVARTSGWAWLVLNLTQTGQTITGSANRAALSGAGNDTGAITGTNNNNVLTITIVFEDMQTARLTGTITSATAMSGTFTTFYPNETPSTAEAWGAALVN